MTAHDVPPQWADEHIAKLRNLEVVSFRPRGRSMEPLVQDNELVHVFPIDRRVNAREPEVGDIVLVTVDGRQYLHKILRVNTSPAALNVFGAVVYQIGNNRGGVNGWVKREAIHGRLVR